jgi:hypothetical protein
MVLILSHAVRAHVCTCIIYYSAAGQFADPFNLFVSYKFCRILTMEKCN